MIAFISFPLKFIFTMLRIIAIVVALSTVAHGQGDGPELDIGILGRIRGSYAQTMGTTERTYMQFLGVRYATQPTRFMPSVVSETPLTDDGSIYNATEFGIRCPQPDESEEYSEDCLFLNIYAPNKTDARHPVLVYIPGAGFTSGGGDWMRGERLLNKDIVLIIPNHRLGIHGACNLEVPEAPGNAMLYDILAVLKWTNQFVSHFGGDPELVTLGGQSSGGAITSHAVVSPLFRGLVHRAIAVSGSTLDPSTFARDHTLGALKVAQFAGCYEPSEPLNRTLVALCLRNLPHEELSRAQQEYYVTEMLTASSIAFDAINPSLQTFLWTDALIPQTPDKTLEKGEQNNIPLMMMVPRDDGSFVLGRLYEDFILPNNFVDDVQFMRDGLIPSIIKSIEIYNPGHMVSGALTKLYIVEEARLSGNFTAMVPSLFDLLSVTFFKAGTLRMVDLHSQLNQDTYLASFEYEGRYKRHPFLDNNQGEVGHADDQIYLFRLSGEFNAEEQALSDEIVNYYVNFMYTGNPNTFPSITGRQEPLPFWPRYSAVTNQYLIMDAESRPGEKYEESWVIANRKD